MTLTDERVPFTPIDEAVHLLDTPAEPWSIQLEVRVAGVIDVPTVPSALALIRADRRRELADAIPEPDVVCAAIETGLGLVTERLVPHQEAFGQLV